MRKVTHQKNALIEVPCRECPRRDLRRIRREDLDAVFRSPIAEKAWVNAESGLASICMIEDGKTGGVNPGDRRALYYRMRALGPSRVLEIGTHVGASTFYIASSLAHNRRADPQMESFLTTVDVEEINDERTGSWKRLGLTHSPRQMIASICCEDRVRFVRADSIEFLQSAKESFDFIFLDSSHVASLVYQEIPLALGALRDDGVILLHDYFPQNRPLWSDGEIVPGPFLAVQRLRSEGAELEVVPLGALPWPTKLGSYVTSLALLTR